MTAGLVSLLSFIPFNELLVGSKVHLFSGKGERRVRLLVPVEVEVVQVDLVENSAGSSGSVTGANATACRCAIDSNAMAERIMAQVKFAKW